MFVKSEQVPMMGILPLGDIFCASSYEKKMTVDEDCDG